MKITPFLLLAGGLCVAAIGQAAEPTVVPETKLSWVDENDTAVADLRQSGERLIDRIGGMMLSEVRRVIANKGLEQAAEEVHLRNIELPTAVPGKPRILAIKRTSLRLRNPLNAPDEADLAALHYIQKELIDGNNPPRSLMQRIESAGKPVEYRVYKPIAVMPDCLLCHGSKEAQIPGLQQSLERQFPEDKAVNYNEYDWRGVIRVTVAAPLTDGTPAAPTKH